MKKLISVLLVLAVLVGAIFAVTNKKTYPEELIYNYMEGSALALTVLNADNYVVAVNDKTKLIYDKKTKKMCDLSQTIFDKREQGTKLICTKGNLLYYLAIDDKTGGSAIFEFNLDTLEKLKVDTRNAVSNPNAFLGTDRVLGIEQGGNDIMMVSMKDVWLSKRGRNDKNSIKDFLAQKDSENKFGVSEISKICTTDEYIFFINELSTLYRFSYVDSSFKKLAESRATDFFITDDKVYYYSADDGDRLFLTSYDGQRREDVTDEKFIDVHIRNGKAYGQTENGEIYEIDGEKYVKTNAVTDSTMWDTDGEFLYVFNPEIDEMEVINLKYSG